MQDDDGGQVLPAVSLVGTGRNEAWLRDFLLQHPSALPAGEIDPAFDQPVAICSELRTPAGPADAFFANRHGQLILVECKLWRNPQARREVVGQILDYAKELTRWGYGELQAAVSQRLGTGGQNSLFRQVAERHPDLEEARFVDAVSSNLQKGRFLLLVAGDGIHPTARAMSEYLQEHAALRFTLAMVEMKGYALPDGRLLVQPRLLMRTEEVERTVFRALEAAGVQGDASQPVAEDNGSVLDAEEGFSYEADKAFWTAFEDRVKFDDPDQQIPRRKGPSSARANVLTPDVWLNVYRSRGDGTIGVVLRLRGKATGLQLYERLAADADAIEAELHERYGNLSLNWRGWQEDRNTAAVSIQREERFDAGSTERHLAYLTEAASAMIAVFRPRLRVLLDGGA